MYEQYTGTAVITQTITQVWDETPTDTAFELSVGPVSGSPTVSYKDADGSYQTYASTNYTVSTIGPIARITKKSTATWPTTGDFPERWKIVYSAGYASASDVPEDIVAAILLMVGFLYENREDIPIGETNNPKIRAFASIAFARRAHLI